MDDKDGSPWLWFVSIAFFLEGLVATDVVASGATFSVSGGVATSVDGKGVATMSGATATS